MSNNVTNIENGEYGVKKATLDGIQFNKILLSNNKKTDVLTRKNSIWYTSDSKLLNTVNAVDINWNEAILGEINSSLPFDNDKLTSTGELLNTLNKMQQEIHLLSAALASYADLRSVKVTWHAGDGKLGILNIETAINTGNVGPEIADDIADDNIGHGGAILASPIAESAENIKNNFFIYDYVSSYHKYQPEGNLIMPNIILPPDNYIFKGWSRTEGGTIDSTINSSYYITQGKYDFYANYENKNATYTICFNLRSNGTGHVTIDGTPGQSSIITTQHLGTINLPDESIMNTLYTNPYQIGSKFYKKDFEGWYVENAAGYSGDMHKIESSSELSINNNGKLCIDNQPLKYIDTSEIWVIYARYTIGEEIDTDTGGIDIHDSNIFEVTLNVEHGSSTDDSMKQISLDTGIGEWVVIPDDGYIMPSSVTLSVSNASNVTISNNTVTVSNVTADHTITLTCVEEPVIYYVNWNANGGTFNDGSSLQVVTLRDGDSITKNKPNDPIRYRYEFKGWGNSSNSTTPIEISGTVTQQNQTNFNFFAIWGDKNYKVKWYANGGHWVSNGITYDTFENTTSGRYLVMPNYPLKRFYTFTGWRTTYTGGSIDINKCTPGSVGYELSNEIGRLNDDNDYIELYACWELQGKYEGKLEGYQSEIGPSISGEISGPNLSSIEIETE